MNIDDENDNDLPWYLMDHKSSLSLPLPFKLSTDENEDRSGEEEKPVDESTSTSATDKKTPEQEIDNDLIMFYGTPFKKFRGDGDELLNIINHHTLHEEAKMVQIQNHAEKERSRSPSLFILSWEQIMGFIGCTCMFIFCFYQTIQQIKSSVVTSQTDLNGKNGQRDKKVRHSRSNCTPLIDEEEVSHSSLFKEREIKRADEKNECTQNNTSEVNQQISIHRKKPLSSTSQRENGSMNQVGKSKTSTEKEDRGGERSCCEPIHATIGANGNEFLKDDIHYNNTCNSNRDTSVNAIESKQPKQKSSYPSLVQSSLNNITAGDNHSSDDERDFVQFFSNDVVKFANVISKSGLDVQKSKEIATKQFFENERYKKEFVHTQEVKIQNELRQRVEKACDDLYECISSIFTGPYFGICIGLGCATRFICLHGDMITHFIINEDPHILDLCIHHLCNCLSSSTTAPTEPYKNDNISFGSTLSSSSWIASYSIPDLSSIFISFFKFMAPTYGECLIKIIFLIIIFSLSHGVIKVFRCDAIHRMLNIVGLMLILVNTSFGRSIITLIVEIFLMNTIFICIPYYYHYTRKKDMFDLPIEGVNGTIKQNLKASVVELQQMRRNIILHSMLYAMGIGFISSFTWNRRIIS